MIIGLSAELMRLTRNNYEDNRVSVEQMMSTLVIYCYDHEVTVVRAEGLIREVAEYLFSRNHNRKDHAVKLNGTDLAPHTRGLVGPQQTSRAFASLVI